jgi:hypothetical protein
MARRVCIWALMLSCEVTVDAMRGLTEEYMKLHPAVVRGLRILALLGAVCAVQSAGADDRTIKVVMDYARLVRLPDGAQTLVIGNPLVADVSMVKDQLFVVTGKSFGTTNLIVLDRSGQQVGESIVTVVPASDKVLVQRGSHRESLSCYPKCVPTVELGDDSAYAQSVIGSIKTHESALNSK